MDLDRSMKLLDLELDKTKGMLAQHIAYRTPMIRFSNPTVAILKDKISHLHYTKDSLHVLMRS